MRGALAARVPRAETLQKPARTRAILIQLFVNFSRGTHRTFKSLKIMCSARHATTISDDCTLFAVDAHVWRAKTAPNRTQNRAIFISKPAQFRAKIPHKQPKQLSKRAMMPQIIFSTSKTTSTCVTHSQRACRAQKLCKNQREHVRF